MRATNVGQQAVPGDWLTAPVQPSGHIPGLKVGYIPIARQSRESLVGKHSVWSMFCVNMVSKETSVLLNGVQ